MLKSITMSSFRSFSDASLPLAPLTVLIGANASGKSNAIDALRLLSWLAQGQRLSTIQYSVQSGDRIVRGKVDDLPLHGGGQFTLGCDADLPEWNRLRITVARKSDGLHIVHEELTTPGATVPLYVLDQPAAPRSSDARVAYNNFAKGGKKPHLTCSDQLAVFTQLVSPAALESKHKKSRARIPPVARKYEAWLARMLFLDPVPAKMREYAFPSDRQLGGDGANLSAVLFNLWGEDTDASDEPYRTQRSELLQFIQSLPEQDIAGLSFLKEPRGGVMVKLTETFGGESRDYDASLLSDGTLRVLSVAAAMLSAPEGSLVVIEEIDNGVHPSRARHLLARIRAIAERRSLRVLLSTHNPALLDALPETSVGDVVFCYRSPSDGTSRLVRLDQIPDYPELVAQGTLGRLSATGLLERFVKDRPSRDVRLARAQQWLASLQAEAAP
ncbi:MAG: ATP-binding protein [Deltaproteobacteria bacterium]|nr:ATP-binding protein [Deltaproteobacteria bacterium]MCB9787983.1 ATP-binding protein [Deltaproteobacteria bacterium]